MIHEEAKNKTLIPMPVHIVNEKMSDKSSLVSDLCCMMAGDTPMSVRRLKKAMMTVATATIPKSSGDSRRASIPATTREMRTPLYLASAV